MSTSDLQYIMFNRTQILVRFRGVSRNITEDEQIIDDILDLCVEYKKAPEELKEEIAEDLLRYINPIQRKDFATGVEKGKDGNLYLKGTDFPMPEELQQVLEIYVEKELPFKPLLNFWRWCIQNPSETAREGFYKYVKDFGIVITDAGYVILYKAMNVSSNPEYKQKGKTDQKLSAYVSNQYMKIKGMKKSPKNYHVFEVQGFDENDDPSMRYEISKHSGDEPNLDDNEMISEDLGVLQELYEDIIEQGKDLEESTEEINVYRPSHLGKHGMRAALGTPVNMPREDCDPDINVGCSYGLHVGSHKYVSSFGSGMDAILAVLVNPRDVVALPHHDHSKIRVCRYFPYAEIVRNDDGSWEELEHGHFEEDFIHYEMGEVKEQLELLRQAAAQGGAVEEKKVDLEKRLVVLESALD
jgi:hypothetical protein